MITQLVTAQDLDSDQLQLAGDVHRHLIRARRLSAGDAVRFVDGQGRARHGILESFDRKQALFVLGEKAALFDPSLELELWVASLRRERAAWMVEKATELGVRGIHFLHTRRAPRSFGTAQLERFRRVAVAALEQSHGAFLPRIEGVHSWEALREILGSTTHRFALLPGADAPLQAATMTAGERIALLIGPEGGLAEDELEQLRDMDFRLYHLGQKILRIETAAVLGAGILLTRDP